MNLIAMKTVFESKIVYLGRSDLDNIIFNVMTTICPFLINQLTSQSIQCELNYCVNQ